MGAKASTANGEGPHGPLGGAHGPQGPHGPSPRTRTFSASSSTEVVAASHGGGPGGPTGLSFLRVHSDRQRERARSLSSVPTLDSNGAALPHGLGHHGHHHGVPVGVYDISESAESDSSSHEEHTLGLDSLGLGHSLSHGLGRVYAAHSLPTNIWSLNGECEVQVRGRQAPDLRGRRHRG